MCLCACPPADLQLTQLNCFPHAGMPRSPRMSEQLPLASRPRLGPKPRLGYTSGPLERAAHLRKCALLTFVQQDDACVYLIAGEMIVLNKRADFHDPLFMLSRARDIGEVSETIFLGLDKNSPRFGVAIDAGAAELLKEQGAFVITDLRSIAVNGLVAPEHLQPLAEAKSLLSWHRRHRYCPNCGAPSMRGVVKGGRSTRPKTKVRAIKPVFAHRARQTSNSASATRRAFSSVSGSREPWASSRARSSNSSCNSRRDVTL